MFDYEEYRTNFLTQVRLAQRLTELKDKSFSLHKYTRSEKFSNEIDEKFKSSVLKELRCIDQEIEELESQIDWDLVNGRKRM